MLAKPQQHGNICDDEGIPTHSALFFVELDRESVLQFFFARPQKKKKFWWAFLGSLACFHSFSFGPINRRRWAAIEARSRRCRRQHALCSSVVTWQDNYPHVFLRPPASLHHKSGTFDKMHCDTAGNKQEQYGEISNKMKCMVIKVGCEKDFVEKNSPVLSIVGWTVQYVFV